MKMRTVVVGALVVATLVPAALAVASTPEPSTREPVATFEVTHDPSGDVMQTCKGADGSYEQITSGASGTITSSDPSLSGQLRTTEQILLNRTTLTGAVVGTVEITDAVTGRRRFSGEVTGVVKGVTIRGLMRGRLADGGFLVANFSAAHDPNTTTAHAIRGTIGAASSPPLDTALIQTSGCAKWPPVGSS